MATYKILSLDGGGVWALVQVKALMAIYGGETVTGHQVLSNFDMAAANSGGSIVLGGLVANKTLGEILALFMDEKNRRSIFQPTKSVLDTLIRWALKTGPKYDTAAKLVAFNTLLGPTGALTLPQAAAPIPAKGSGKPVHLLIMGFDFDRQLAAFFRSAEASRPGWGAGSATTACTLAEAIHASSTPPVAYFDAPTAFGKNRYWDGAIAAYNNPVNAAVAEALVMGAAPADIRALTIGTGTKRLHGPPVDNAPPLQMSREKTSLTHDLGELSGALTDDPPDVASFMAHVLSGGPPKTPAGVQSRIVRMSPMISPDRTNGVDPPDWRIPTGFTTDSFTHLTNLALDALDQPDVDLIASYGDLWIQDGALNHPVRMNADSLKAEIGRDRFSAARADWNALTGD